MKIDDSKYKTKKELFEYLVQNKSELIALKRAEVKHADSVICENISNHTTKEINYNNQDELDKGSIKRLIVGNTYKWMDSHDDVHMEGIFTKSIKENKQRILHLHDHEYKLTSKVGKPIDIYEAKIKLTELGQSKAGDTDALFMFSNIKQEYNEKIYKQYLDKEINQHSVGMVYVKLFLAVNDSDYKEEYEAWLKYFPHVINQDKAIDKGYFWAVTEAKLIEISAVIAGSNELTPTFEPQKSTQINETDNTTHNKVIDYKYLIDNFKL